MLWPQSTRLASVTSSTWLAGECFMIWDLIFQILHGLFSVLSRPLQDSCSSSPVKELMAERAESRTWKQMISPPPGLLARAASADTGLQAVSHRRLMRKPMLRWLDQRALYGPP